MRIEAKNDALITRSLRSGTSTVISMCGTLDGPAAAMVAAYLLDQVDVASGDFYIDLRAVDLVDGAEVPLVTALQRRLAVRGHQLHLTPPDATGSATVPLGRCPVRRSDTRRSRWREHRRTTPRRERPDVRRETAVTSMEGHRVGELCEVTFRRRPRTARHASRRRRVQPLVGAHTA